MADAALDAAVAETQKLLGAQIQKVVIFLIRTCIVFTLAFRTAVRCLVVYYFKFLSVFFSAETDRALAQETTFPLPA